jgi:hypothetical protein
LPRGSAEDLHSHFPATQEAAARLSNTVQSTPLPSDQQPPQLSMLFCVSMLAGLQTRPWSARNCCQGGQSVDSRRLTTRMTRFCLQIQGRRCNRVHRLAHASFPCCRSVLAYKHPGWHPVPFPKGRGRTLMALCIRPVVHAVRVLGRQSISASRNSTHFLARADTVAVCKDVSLSPMQRCKVIRGLMSSMMSVSYCRVHIRERN